MVDSQNFQYYKASGKVGIGTFVYALIGCVLAIGWAYLYAFVLDRVPYILVSVGMAVVFAIGIAVLSSLITSKGHCRNAAVAFGIGILLLVVSMTAKHYFQYGQLIDQQTTATVESLITQEGLPPAEAHAMRPKINGLLKQELPFQDHFQPRADFGISIGEDGFRFSGLSMYLLWLAEAGLVFFAATSLESQANELYCEQSGSWIKQTSIANLPITDEEVVDQVIDVRSLEDLLAIPAPRPDDLDDADQYVEYGFWSVPDDENATTYLSVDLFMKDVSDDDQLVTTRNSIVKHVLLTPDQHKQFRDKLIPFTVS